MYELFFGSMQFPIAPSKINMKIANKNKTVVLMDEGEVNVLKSPGLTEITFDVELPNVKYPYAVYPNGFKPAAYYLEKLETRKIKKHIFQFIVTRSRPNGKLLFDTNLKVTLEDYEIKEDAENGFDVVVSITLKQYRDYGTQKVKLKKKKKGSNSKKKVATKIKKRATKKSTPKPYIVKKGDTLWAICKRFLGDPTLYPQIAKLNKIKNPNLIYPGDVIRFE